MKKTLLITICCLILNKVSSQTWSALGSGVSSSTSLSVVRTMIEYNGGLYAGGLFDTAGGTPAHNIAKWNGNWSSVSSGMDSTIFALAVYNNELYAGGAFIHAGGGPANHIARWNGTSWDSLGSGVDGTVFSLAVYNNDLYAAGSFGSAGGFLCYGIAKWNGTSWSAVASSLSGIILTLGVFNNELYSGGQFSAINGIPLNNIAKWNGVSWSSVGAGVVNGSSGADIDAFATFNSELYVGGFFDSAGSVAADYIAKYDGQFWSVVGSGLDSRVYTSVVYNNELYTGGAFLHAGSVPVNFIAKWNGTNWSAVGSGLNWFNLALAVYNGDLYAGGYFSIAGGIVVNGIARWNSPLSVETYSSSNSTTIFPSPANNEITIESDLESKSFELHDATGKLIFNKEINSTRFKLDISHLSKGIYFLTINGKNNKINKKIIKD